MKSFDFEYDGMRLSDKGFIICKFKSNGVETISNGSYITFNTVSTMRGAKHELISSEYSECLKTSFQICKHPCIIDEEDREITISELCEIMQWLNRKEFHKFKLLDAEYTNIFFEASFNISKIESDGKIYGLELEMFTNRPYALQEPVLVSLKTTKTNEQRQIFSKSYEEGYIYPDMDITINADGDFEFYNVLEERTMRIANCKSGEVIKVRYPIITSSLATHKIQNDFNWKFFRIVNAFKTKMNNVEISIPCTIEMKYSPIVKVGI